MSFYGCHFSFDGVPCTEFGLMMYDFGGGGTEEDTLTPDVEIVEDRIARKYTPLHYGTIMNKPLQFNMTFGADIDSIDRNVYLDRYDLDAISSWLTGHDKYKWLEITQPDMEIVRYKCFITNLKHVDVGKYPWGLTCTVICDSPFGYLYPETYTYTVNESLTFNLLSKSSYRGYYKPKMVITLSGGGGAASIDITNNSDDEGRQMTFTNLPSDITQLVIDNENEIVTCNSTINPYAYFNFNFFRLIRGKNSITANCNGTVRFICEFPVNVGG